MKVNGRTAILLDKEKLLSNLHYIITELNNNNVINAYNLTNNLITKINEQN